MTRGLDRTKVAVAGALGVMLLTVVGVEFWERSRTAISPTVAEAGKKVPSYAQDEAAGLGQDAGTRRAIHSTPRPEHAANEQGTRFTLTVLTEELGLPLAEVEVHGVIGDGAPTLLGRTGERGRFGPISHRRGLELYLVHPERAKKIVSVDGRPGPSLTVQMALAGMIVGNVVPSDQSALAGEVFVTAIPIGRGLGDGWEFDRPYFWPKQLMVATEGGSYTLTGLDAKSWYTIICAGPGYISALPTTRAFPDGGSRVSVQVDYLFGSNAHIQLEFAQREFVSMWGRIQSTAADSGLERVFAEDPAWSFLGRDVTERQFAQHDVQWGNSMMIFRSESGTLTAPSADFQWGAPGCGSHLFTVSLYLLSPPPLQEVLQVRCSPQIGGDLVLHALDEGMVRLPVDARFWVTAESENGLVHFMRPVHRGQRLPIRLEGLPVGRYEWGWSWERFLLKQTGTLEHGLVESSLVIDTDPERILRSSGQVRVELVDGLGRPHRGPWTVAVEGPFKREPVFTGKMNASRILMIHGPRSNIDSLEAGFYRIAALGTASRKCFGVVRVEQGRTADITLTVE